jgi:DNA-binding NarL/FixJ family response regulator
VIRVLIVEDNKFVRDSIRLLLKRMQDLEVVGEARDGQEAIALTDQLIPDVILMDVQMPVLDGLEATARIHAKHQDVRIVMLTLFSERTLLRQALLNGAMGWVSKKDSFDELGPAIHSTFEGKKYFCASLGPIIDEFGKGER